MQKALLFIVSVFCCLSASLLIVIVALFYFLSPVSPALFIVFLFCMACLYEIFFLKLWPFDSKYKIYLLDAQIVIVCLYITTAIVLHAITTTSERTRWSTVNLQLELIGDNIVSHFGLERHCPESIDEICKTVACEDLFSPGDKFKYRVLNDEICLVYSIGPDRVDNDANIVSADDAVKYSPYSSPWNLMPLGKTMLRLSGLDKNLNGDIVKIVGMQELEN